MSDFKGKMHQIRFWLGLRPRPRWGSLQRAPPDPLAGGEGLAAPSPRTPLPLSALQASQTRPFGPRISALRASPLPSVPGNFSHLLAPERNRTGWSAQLSCLSRGRGVNHPRTAKRHSCHAALWPLASFLLSRGF